MIKKSKYHAFTILSAITLLIVVCLMCKQRTDTAFSRLIYGESFYATGNCTAVTEGRELTVKNIDNDIIAVSSSKMTLDAGNYNFAFLYHLNGGQPAIMEIRRDSYLAADNTEGRVYYSQKLEQGSVVVQNEFVLDERMHDVYIRVILPADSEFTLSRIGLESGNVYINDYNIFSVLIICAYGIATIFLFSPFDFSSSYEYKGNIISGKRKSFILVTIFSAVAVFATLPLMRDSINAGLDLVYHMNRIEGISENILSGRPFLPIHTELLNGYGYPNGIFYPQLFLYFPAILRASGMSLVNSYRTFVLILNFFTVMFTYISAKKMFSSHLCGIVTAILYTLNPYRLACMYERMAVGEYIALTFIPLIAYGLYAALYGNKKDWPYLVLGATGIFQSHILSTEIIAVLCVIIAVFSLKKLFGREKRIVTVMKAAFSTLAINLWFIVPMRNTLINVRTQIFNTGADITKSAVGALSELFSSSLLIQHREIYTGYTPAGIGVVFSAVIVLFLIYILSGRIHYGTEEEKRIYAIGCTALVICVFLLLMVTDLFPWHYIQRLPFISNGVKSLQFTFRLMGVIMLCISVIAAVVVSLCNDEKNKMILVSALLSAFIVLTSLFIDSIAYNGMNLNYGTKMYFDLQIDGGCVSQAEYLPENMSVADINNAGVKILADADVDISSVTRNNGTITFDYTKNSEGAVDAQIPLLYYPGYVAAINGESISVKTSDNGIIIIRLPGMSGHVEVCFQTPFLYKAANVISILSFSLLVCSIMIDKKRTIKTI